MVNFFTGWIEFIASHLHDNYGLAIIVVTVCVRVVLLPLFINQQKHMTGLQDRMKAVQPQIDEIRQRMMGAGTQEKKLEAQQELFYLYKKQKLNPISPGILPMLLQIPVFYGLYMAIKSSHEIAEHAFLWFDLGQRDPSLALIVGVITFIQMIVIQRYQPPSDNQMTEMINRMTKIMMPGSLLLVSLMVPAALSLYFAIGGIFVIGQTIFIKNIMKA